MIFIFIINKFMIESPMIKRPHTLDTTMPDQQGGRDGRQDDVTPEQEAWIAAAIAGASKTRIPEHLVSPLGPVLQTLANKVGGP